MNHLTIFSALEQFDVVNLFVTPITGHINNVVVFLAIVAGLAAFSLSTSTFSESLGLLNSKFFFLGAFFGFAKNLFRENINVSINVFFYFLTALFSFLLVGNLVGLVPYALTVTSYIVVTFFFSCTGFIASALLGLYIHRSHFFSLFIPAGTPAALKGALVFIELVSYVARLFSLAIRIFANMMAGHALLKILSGFAWLFLQNLTLFGIAALVVLAVVWAVTVLELMMAFLQSYVFVVLTSIYLNEAVNLH